MRDARVGAGYFAMACLSISTTRFDGGLAFLWLGSGFLITVLLLRPRRKWPGAVAWSALGGLLATGLYGVGWAVAFPLAVANMAEAVLAALILRRARAAAVEFGSFRWEMILLLAAGIAGPLAMALIGAWPIWASTGQHPAVSIPRVVTGHGLSNLAFIPIFKLYATGSSGLWRRRFATGELGKLFLLFAVEVAVGVGVFAQTTMPLLFLPILPVMAIVFTGGSRRTALALMLLAVIGAGFTLAGHGPIAMASAGTGSAMQLLQFYLLANVATVVPIAVQLRSRARLVRRVRDSEARYRMLADHSSDIITHSDLYGRILFASPSVERIAGYDPKILEGTQSIEIIDPRDHQSVRQCYSQAILSAGEPVRFEYRGLIATGEWRWFESTCRGVTNGDGRTESIVSIVRDISDRKRHEEALSLAAMTDALTGLANRRAFRDRAQALLAVPGAKASIAILDIDHFKSINDCFGHDIGDEVLRAFAGIARGALRQEDFLARIGGEEFAILFPGMDDSGAAKACDRIRAAIAESGCPTSAGDIRVTISGGVAPLGSGGLDSAMKRADVALYAAKSQGRDRLALAA